MVIGQAINAQLTADATVSGLVADRVSPQIQAQESQVYPSIVYSGQDAAAVNSYTGSNPLCSQTIKISCLATTYSGMNDLGVAVYKALNDQAGTWGGIVIQGCFFRSESEDTIQVTDMGQDSELFVKDLEFLIWFIMP